MCVLHSISCGLNVRHTVCDGVEYHRESNAVHYNHDTVLDACAVDLRSSIIVYNVIECIVSMHETQADCNHGGFK